VFCCVRLGVLGKSVSFHYFFCCLGKSQAARPVSDRRLKIGSLPENKRFVATIVLCLLPWKKQARRDGRPMSPPPIKPARGRQTGLLPPDRRASAHATAGPGLLPSQKILMTKKMPRLFTALAPNPPTTLPNMRNIIILSNILSPLFYTLYSALKPALKPGPSLRRCVLDRH
jgi:hypothetical protein